MTSEIRTGRIVLTTFGSLGDLHPYLALGLGLKKRGHAPVIATSPTYRERVEALGLEFAPVRPDLPEWKSNQEVMQQVMNLRTGSEYVVRQMIMPALRDSYDDTLAAARGADVLVSHPLTFGAPLAAERLGLPWVSSVLAPLSFFSAHDPPVLPPAPWMRHARCFGAWLWRPLFRLARRSCRSWSVPYHRLRADLGFPPTAADPLFEGQHSPHLVLAMFSSLFAERQPDWPPATRVTGFAFHDRDLGETGLSPELAHFVQSGTPPLVFTLGSAAVMDPGSFFAESARAAQQLGRRAVLLTGKDQPVPAEVLSDQVAAFPYAPFSELFLLAAAIVHQGGAGTTGQAMQSGRPMLVMPYAHDQPDNADRVVRLGIARTISRRRYRSNRVAAELRQLLENPEYERRALQVGNHVAREEGVTQACVALEEVLADPSLRSSASTSDPAPLPVAGGR
ncbi:MAG: glycosyltransferase [Planctomycetales bacterium]